MTGQRSGPAGRPQLVVSDLDGTFLSPDGTVSELNARAVERARAAGIVVVFATGRPVRWLEVIADLPGAHPLVIASNGAVLYDQGSGIVLDRVYLEPAVTVRAVSAIRRLVPDAAFAFESGDRFGHEPAYVTLARDASTNPDVYQGAAEEMAGAKNHVKLLVQHPELDSDALLARVRDAIGDSMSATHATPLGRPREAGLVEVSAAGVTKASMLSRCCARLGIAAADVAAFGDMPNDLDMLGWAGRGFVVANGHPLLLAAYPVVPGCADSGVGRTILDWLR